MIARDLSVVLLLANGSKANDSLWVYFRGGGHSSFVRRKGFKPMLRALLAPQNCLR